MSFGHGLSTSGSQTSPSFSQGQSTQFGIQGEVPLKAPPPPKKKKERKFKFGLSKGNEFRFFGPPAKKSLQLQLRLGFKVQCAFDPGSSTNNTLTSARVRIEKVPSRRPPPCRCFHRLRCRVEFWDKKMHVQGANELHPLSKAAFSDCKLLAAATLILPQVYPILRSGFPFCDTFCCV